MPNARTNRDGVIEGDDVWLACVDAVVDRLQFMGWNTTQGGWFWDKKTKIETRIGLVGPFRRPVEAFTNVSTAEELVCRIQLTARGKEMALLLSRTTKMIQDVKRSMHHDDQLKDAVQASLKGDYPVNIIDVRVEFPDPVPEEETDEENTTRLATNMVVADVIFWVEECLRNSAKLSS